jgi:hypothetical protein
MNSSFFDVCLMKLLLGDGRSDIATQIFPLDDALHFQVLCHLWGSPDDSAKMKLESGTLAVQLNLGSLFWCYDGGEHSILVNKQIQRGKGTR